mmetsp:Transcript_1406/g.3092  ORF Transcript_1406/g.3092 Transcript_1406/m.3092 type:complete len:156 (+) Transcript_1406:136-603(+)
MPLRAKWIALASVCVLSFWNTILQVPSLPLGDHSNSFDHAPPAVTSVSATADEQLHIALALSGREPGVFDEFEAALKSVLLNAPFERSLFVHIFADSNAYEELDGVLIRTQVTSWERWRCMWVMRVCCQVITWQRTSLLQSRSYSRLYLLKVLAD